MPISERDKARFWSKVDKRGSAECWPWTDKPTAAGYGMLSIGGRAGGKVYAHRLSYEINVGPIPDELTIDHVVARGCAGGLCVNPAHLESVTRGVNTARGNATDVCPRGHDRKGPSADVYVNPKTGAVLCRPCARIHDHKRRAA